jgi:Terminase large subunit, T4likevirus-type, N-terminal
MTKPLWEPSERQTEFLAATEDEVLFGGAAGGGKSDALLIDALGGAYGATDKPTYRALLIRQTFPELRELIDRSQLIYPIAVPGAEYHTQDKEWRFPSGAKIIFGYCERDADVYQYQGQQFQWIGIDELGHYATPRVWEYLSSRLRSTDRSIRCYMRATCNPGPKWIMERFGIDPSGAPSLVVVDVDGTKIKRRFIPSRLSDNPHLEGSGYEQRLKLLPDADRRALLHGEWGVIDVPGSYYGSLIKRARDDGRICHVPYEPKLPVHTFWDLGVGDSTAIWFAQIHSSERRLIDYYEASGEGFQHYKQVLNEKNYLYGEHWAPHDIEVRNLGVEATSRKEIAASLGIHFRVAPKLSFDDGINASRMLFPTCYFDAKKTEKGLEALIHYRKDFNQRLGEFKTGPVHDWASHGADAFRYFAVSIERVTNGADSWTRPLKYDSRGVV